MYCSGGRHFTEELWALLCPPSLLPLSIFKVRTIQPYTQKCWIHQMSWTPMVSLRSCLHVMSMKKTNSRPSEKWFFFACCLTYQIQMVPDKNGFCLFQTKIVFVLWSSTLYNLLTNLCPFPNNLDISGGFICKMNRFLYIGCNKRTSFAYKTTFTYPLVLYLYCFIKW